MTGARRTLVIDADELTALIARTLLEAEGIEVVTATDAQSARSALSAETFDAIVLSLRLPGAIGVQFIDEVRRDPKNASAKLMLTCALARPEDSEAGLRAGADAVAATPIDPAVFIDRFTGMFAPAPH